MSAKPQPQTEKLTTITGKVITVSVAFRLPANFYDDLRRQAQKEGKKVAGLVQEWVLEKLSGVKVG